MGGIERGYKRSQGRQVLPLMLYADVSAVMGVALVILLRYFRCFIQNAFFCYLANCVSFIALFSLAMCQLEVCTVQEVCSLMNKVKEHTTV